MPNANITVKDALEQLEALGDEKVRTTPNGISW
jgi:hypothetical protein